MRARTMRGFVLLEVLVSLVILSLGATAVLQSLRQSLTASRQAEIVNQAVMLAENLLEEVQISPPASDRYQGDFGEDFEEFSYEMTIEDEDLRYRGRARYNDDDDFRPLRLVHLEVYYDSPRRAAPLRVLAIDSAILGFQKFTHQALNEYQLYELY